MRSYSSGFRPWRSRTCGVDHRRSGDAARAELSACTTDSKITRPSTLPSSDFAGALGMRHQADDVARLVADAGDRVDRSVRVRRVVDVAVRRRCSGRRPGGSPRAARARRAARSSCLRRGRSECAAPGRRGAPRVNGVSVCSTRRWTCSQRNFSPRLRSIAPGSRPASSRIWKPLQMPSTGPPRVGERLHRAP